MPWSHCDAAFILDDETCPQCGAAKAAWTVEADRTRTLVVGGSRRARPWLDLELLDAEGRPAAGQRYEVAFANGRVATGELDALGLARVQPLVPGECQVRFPGLEGAVLREPPLEVSAAAPRPAAERAVSADRGGAPRPARAVRAPAPEGVRAALAAGERGALRRLRQTRRVEQVRRGPPPPRGERRPERAASGPLVLTREQCSRDGGVHHVFRSQAAGGVKVTIPLRLTFPSLVHAQRWLSRRSIEARLDGARVPCGVVARGRDRLEVHLRVPPGEHVLVVRAGAAVLAVQRLSVSAAGGPAQRSAVSTASRADGRASTRAT